MTCIVAAIDRFDRRRVLMCADSAGVSVSDIRTRIDQKMFVKEVKVTDDLAGSRQERMLFGFSYCFRFGQILSQSLPFLPATPANNPKLPYIVTKLVPIIRETLANHGYPQPKTDEITHESQLSGHLLLGFMGGIYKIYTDYQVEQILQPFNAIGSGESYAMGCLHGLYHRLKTEKAVDCAMEAAAEFTAGVRPPFTLLST